ncbi:MAG: hypothetical protein AAGG02_04885 [Cyanobacteria bacterium P01_H01_bin.15]
MKKGFLNPEQRNKFLQDFLTSSSSSVRQKTLMILLMDEGENIRDLDSTRLRKEEIKRTNLDLYANLLTPEQSNRFIREKISSQSPLMVSRLGNIEARCIKDFLQAEYSPQTYQDMSGSPGFFPIQKEMLDRFSRTFLSAAESIDLLGVWFNPGEPDIIRQSCPEANLVSLSALEPYFQNEPWSQALSGKRVMVIHPFAETIIRQYENHRKHLFEDPRILPQFELLTFKAVQSFAGQPTAFSTWFDALDWMCEQIQQQDFEMALIGCGAYGLSLAAYIKHIGKQAIHLGGALQILFGIKGRRWDADPSINRFYNQHWVRPSREEQPQNYQKYPAYW